jgi:hypothetical protein
MLKNFYFIKHFLSAIYKLGCYFPLYSPKYFFFFIAQRCAAPCCTYTYGVANSWQSFPASPAEISGAARTEIGPHTNFYFLKVFLAEENKCWCLCAWQKFIISYVY